MKLTQQKIYENIEEIKETIECSKRKFSGLYKLFLGYGILQGILFIFDLIGSITLWSNFKTTYLNFAAEMVTSIIVVILYVKVYKSEKNTSNRYYLITLSIWGIMVTVMPFLLLTARLLNTLWGNESAIVMLKTLEDYDMLANMMLICSAIIMVGYIIDKRWLLVISILLLFGFIIVRGIPVVMEIPILVKGNIKMSLTLSASAIVYYVFNIGGYIGLGTLLKYQEKKSGNI